MREHTFGGGGTPFEDRRDAGRRLAERLREEGVEADLVLGIPRGGLPVAYEVAAALDARLDVVVASKIGAPGNPELAIGAAASDGSVWLDEDSIARFGVDDAYLDREREREAQAAAEKAARYRDDGDRPDVAGRRVVVADDGVATGATARAALRLVEEGDAGHVVLAVPVGSPRTIEELRTLADEVVCVETPTGFRAVGQFYRRFDQVSDAEAMGYLEEYDAEEG